MKLDESILKCFDELIKKANEVKTTKRKTSYGEFFDQTLFQEWSISVLSLFGKIFKKDSPQIVNFQKQYEEFNKRGWDMYLERCIGILLSAYNDYKNGYLFDIETAVSADVLDTVLEQAEELFKAKYKDASAIIVGVALETALRKLCKDAGIAIDKETKANTMNDSLAKACKYNVSKQKEITAWLGRRNDAAHGHWDRYTATDVKAMIDGVNNFIADYL